MGGGVFITLGPRHSNFAQIPLPVIHFITVHIAHSTDLIPGIEEMKLINTTSLEIEEFLGSAVPSYAILSHTWENEEVSFQDFTLQRSYAESRKGFSKIERACSLARGEGIAYAWVDTCCIDKTNSAELTEAINSMYQWYASSVVCYAYLSDLALHGSAEVPDTRTLEGCRWFTRGWTLQELIAPSRVVFFDAVWRPCGTKVDLGRELSTITKIDYEVLLNPSILSTIPCARKMSWAASRQTTRVEDIAYSLLGIFGVNMPMLYGEAEGAFIRLQEEIIKQSADMTLFAWQATTKSESQRYHGILAKGPEVFATAVDIEYLQDPRYNHEFSVTNRGVKLWERVVRPAGSSSNMLKLNCFRRGEPDTNMAIHLKRHGSGQLFAREQPHTLATLNSAESGDIRDTIYISRTVDQPLNDLISREHKDGLALGRGWKNSYFNIQRQTPPDLWNGQMQLFLTQGGTPFVGYIYCLPKYVPAGAFIVVCGMGEEGPWAVFLQTGGQLVKDAVMKSDFNVLGQIAQRDGENVLELGGARGCHMTLSIQSKIMDRESVYFIDIDITPLL